MTTLAVYSNKGGVGKTAAAVNLSYLAARTGFRTLLCDLDPQGSATYYFRVKPKLKSGAKGLAKGGKRVLKSIKGTDYENLDLLPADFSLRNLDITLSGLKHPDVRLKKILRPLEEEYRLIMLDCPVTISVLAENILSAADYTLVPLIPTALSIRAHRQLLSFCKKKRFHVGSMYTFFSMVDRHKKMHRELVSSASQLFDGVLENSIPYSAEIEKMGIHRAPVAGFSPGSTASRSYQELWDKIQKIISLRDR
ncbi:MAG: AAA family ATPase [Deltaproteobacteria bacterium]|nr:AAA family ATPase [Deltaproteobacteria bacterium]